MEQRVPILVYHHVYPDEEAGLTDTARHRATGVIGESAFRRQMSYIADSGWSVVSTTRVVDWLEGGAALPARSVALHFDNGWLDAFTMALPVLRGLAMTGTCYVITDGTGAASEGRAATVRTSTEGAVDKPFITWDHASEMLSDGWEIGAHTASHPRLADVHASDGDDGVLAEVERSNAGLRRAPGLCARALRVPQRLPQRVYRRPARAPLPISAALALQPSAAMDLHGPRHVSPGPRLPERGQYRFLRGFHRDLQGGPG